MGSFIPVHVWLLLLIGLMALAPGAYCLRYLRHSPSRRDVTQPIEDLPWRTQQRLVLSLAALAGLAGLAVWIFTPSAAAFAHSPEFVPLLLGGIGIWLGYVTVKGLMTGTVEPMVRGVHRSYERAAEPVRYWLSMTWNGLFTAFMLFGAFGSVSDSRRDPAEQAIADRCFDSDRKTSPQDEVEACDTLIADPARRRGYDLSSLHSARAFAYNAQGLIEHALADYSEAIRLNGKDAYPFYNRGLLYERVGNTSAAIDDFSTVLNLEPDDPDALANRGYCYGRTGDMPRAIADFTKAIRQRPNEPGSYVYRGMAYRQSGQEALARADFAAAVRLRPDILKDPQMARAIGRQD